MAVVAGCAVAAAEYADVFRPLTLPEIGESAPVGIAWRPQTPRLAYRYSIVPGGVWSADDVVQAIEDDPVVAAHYHRLDLTRLRSEVLAESRTAYVSYRTSRDIGWTSRRVQVGAGEAVLTDGTTTIRARCGNVLSDEAVADAADERFDPAVLDQIDPAASFAFGRPVPADPRVSAPDAFSDPAAPLPVHPLAATPASSPANVVVDSGVGVRSPGNRVTTAEGWGGTGGLVAVAGGGILVPALGLRSASSPADGTTVLGAGPIALDPPLSGSPGLGGTPGSPASLDPALAGSGGGSVDDPAPLPSGPDTVAVTSVPGLPTGGPALGGPASGGPGLGSMGPADGSGSAGVWTVPEPSSWALVLIALVGWWLYRLLGREKAERLLSDLEVVDGSDDSLSSFESEHEKPSRRRR